jgi:hypothetical protein
MLAIYDYTGKLHGFIPEEDHLIGALKALGYHMEPIVLMTCPVCKGTGEIWEKED